MSQIQPLSSIVDNLQELSMSKGEGIMTGINFKNEYGRDDEIAFAGGDIHNAYSKMYNMYKMAKDTDTSGNKFEISNNTKDDFNIEIVIKDMEFALENLNSAINRLKVYDDDKITNLTKQLKNIRENISEHKSRIENTGVIFIQ
jgi:molecular chaperone GrpE (heat shock protein)